MAEEGIRACAAALRALHARRRTTSKRAATRCTAPGCAAACSAASAMGLHHKLCHTLGGSFNLPHAEVHTVVLPHALAYNAGAAPQAHAAHRSALWLAGAGAAARCSSSAQRHGAPTSLTAHRHAGRRARPRRRPGGGQPIPEPAPARARRTARAAAACLRRRRAVMRRAWLVAVAAALSACAAPPVVPVARVVPPTDCTAWVGTDRNAELPGYLLPQANGATQCVPLLQTANKPPPGYSGDYYVDEFTDAKLKERWAACKADAACFKRIDDQMQRWLPPNKERATRVTGLVDPVGKIDSDGDVDLRQIRKPGFFAKAPYREAIAEADGRTHVVEFTVPRDPLERLKLNMHGRHQAARLVCRRRGSRRRPGRPRARARHHERGRRQPAHRDPASGRRGRHCRPSHAANDRRTLPERHHRRPWACATGASTCTRLNRAASTCSPTTGAAKACRAASATPTRWSRARTSSACWTRWTAAGACACSRHAGSCSKARRRGAS